MATTKEQTFDRRAISDTVREHRGYLYLAGAPHEHDVDGNPIVPKSERARGHAAIARDVARVRAVDPSVADEEYTSALRRRVSYGAWAILKHPAMRESGPIRVQFKEDHPPRKAHSHWHGDYGPKARVKHVNGKRSGHRGIDPEGIHTHPKPAKYRMMPRPRRRYEHMHYGDGAPRNIKEHVAEPKPFGHDGDDREYWPDVAYPDERHEHPSHHPASGNFENRLDMHPDATVLLPNARRVFFSIEGVLKADALLSRDEAVFAVPSVTLWDAPELEEFAELYLIGKTAYIVPDSDWASNMQVSAQAFECRERLRSYGIDAHVAAAEPTCGRVCEHDEEAEAHKRGVDDSSPTTSNRTISWSWSASRRSSSPMGEGASGERSTRSCGERHPGAVVARAARVTGRRHRQTFRRGDGEARRVLQPTHDLSGDLVQQPRQEAELD